jgi:Amt family ammonium transporter
MELFFWLIAAAGALLIRAGFALYATGMARSKNSAATLMRHLCDLCVSLIVFWAVGYAIVSSDARVFSINFKSLIGLANLTNVPPFYFACGVLVATGIVPGVLAERARFWPILAGSLVLGGLIVPVAMLWAKGGHGWLQKLDLIDVGGAAWLHLPGALGAAVGAYFVGPRSGKFNRDGSSTAIPGHSLPLAGIGVFVLLVGFFLFVAPGAGSMNVLLAAASGGLAGVLLSHFRYHKPDIHLTLAAVLGALVAISAGADRVPGIAAVLIGAVAGILIPMAILTLDVVVRIDDPTGQIAIHGLGAIWGLIAAPLLASGLSAGERFKHLGVQLLAILTIGLLTIALSGAIWVLLKNLAKIRASEADEFDGLDLAEHDIGAYPDFQQTMIKSYHLREV